MQAVEVRRATEAATAIASSRGLQADGAVVLHNSNQLALRLTPCDVLARVNHDELQIAHLELERAQLFAEASCPVGAVEPRVAPSVYIRDDFAVTLWTYYPQATAQVEPVEYARALQQLHAGLRTVDIPSPRFTDRIADAQEVMADPDLSPELTDADRAFLGRTLKIVRQRVENRGAAEQLLHGEPHPGNLLSTQLGPLFIDFETICRGPVEFDLAHVPEAVCGHYPDLDDELLEDCRQLVLAMVAAWRWQIGDEFPDRRQWGLGFLSALRDGPPWPTPDVMTQRMADRLGPTAGA